MLRIEKSCMTSQRLFSEEGELKRYSIHYDENGRSKGTAEVVFVRHSDALSAIKKYNNMRLDGKPLQIELVGTSSPVVAPFRQNNLLGRPNDSLLRYEILILDRFSFSVLYISLLPSLNIAAALLLHEITLCLS